MSQSTQYSAVRIAIEITVYLLLVLAIVSWCLIIMAPFVNFIIWGTIIAVAAYTPFLRLRAALGERKKLAVFVFAVIGLTVVIVPAWMFAGSMIESAQSVKSSFEAGSVTVPPPNVSVKEWPLVGEKLYSQWAAASSNLEDFLTTHHDQVINIAGKTLSGVAGIGMSILQLVAATLIAAALLANDVSTKLMIHRIFTRLVGDKAPEMINLTAATIRSVTIGVLGIALIQAVLGGVGMMFAGVPAAGVWALFILILAIAQLPPLLVLLPAILYVFSAGDSTTVAVVFTIWSVLVSFSDAILKPMFLGRGVEAPMLVILLGAIGGMIHSGIVGLFIGAVILALGYKLLMTWMDTGEGDKGIHTDDLESESNT